MTSITINLTLEQVLEFIQNLPLEYKQAVKQKLESEKVEELREKQSGSISVSVSDYDEHNILELHDGTISTRERATTLADIEEIQNKVEKLRENNGLESLKKEFYTEKDKKEIEQPKKSILDEIAGIIKDDNLPDYKTLRDAAIIENYKQKS